MTRFVLPLAASREARESGVFWGLALGREGVWVETQRLQGHSRRPKSDNEKNDNEKSGHPSARGRSQLKLWTDELSLQVTVINVPRVNELSGENDCREWTESHTESHTEGKLARKKDLSPLPSTPPDNSGDSFNTRVECAISCHPPTGGTECCPRGDT